jgi:hypothetical protein
VSAVKKKEAEAVCPFQAGDTVLIEIHVDRRVTTERATILRLNPTWAILQLGSRSVTAFLSQLRPAPEADREA